MMNTARIATAALFQVVAHKVDAKVLFDVLAHVDLQSRVYVCTAQRVSKRTGVSVSAAARSLRKLQSEGFMCAVQNGVWIVEPSIVKTVSVEDQQAIRYLNQGRNVPAHVKPLQITVK